MAFLDHYRTFAEKLVGYLEACAHPDALDTADRTTRLGVRTNRPRVYVVAGLGGGTGGGGTCDAQATGINDSGVVVGMIDIGARCGEPHVFLWDGRMHIVDCPHDAPTYCWPRAINARGDVVGDTLNAKVGGSGYAFIYRDGTFHRLDELVDASGWKFEYAIGINDAGQILGWGTLNGEMLRHAFVLTPR